MWAYGNVRASKKVEYVGARQRGRRRRTVRRFFLERSLEKNQGARKESIFRRRGEAAAVYIEDLGDVERTSLSSSLLLWSFYLGSLAIFWGGRENRVEVVV